MTKEVDIAIKDFTDRNWDHGINRFDPAVIVEDSVLLPLIAVGTPIRIGTDEVRIVNRVWKEGNAIWFDGSAIVPEAGGYPNQIQITVSPQIEAEYNVLLFEKAFGQLEFGKIPLAWGKPEKSLEKKTKLIKIFSELSPSVYHLNFENDSYKVAGIDPQLSFEISNFGFSGQDVDLLKFNFSCLRKNHEPRIQVFWWGDDRQGPFEASSVKFTADDGALIVPLDSVPRWRTLEIIRGIRIDLDNAAACGAINITNPALYQRNNIFE